MRSITAKHILFFLLLLFIITPSFADSLTASVDRDELGLSETLTLTLRYDEQINSSPDYSLLQKDFEILHTQSGRNMSIINGRSESYTEWKIILAPKKIGKLLIPSFKVNGDISEAIEITVTKQSSKITTNGKEPVTVQIETDKDNVYTQEQIILTVKLITTVSLSGAQLDPLTIPDAFVTELDEKNYKVNLGNQNALVVEKRFAIFPTKSGSMTIPTLRYQVAVDDGDVWSRFSGTNNILRLMTEEKTINVKPAPADKPYWLPAENLHISEHWSGSLDNLKVGEPISRTVTITAQGLTAAQIPPMATMKKDGLTFYQDQAQTDDQKNKKGNQGSRIETTAVVPNKQGQFTLPEIQVEWWNTKTKTIELATLPAVTLNVTSGESTVINNQNTNRDQRVVDESLNQSSDSNPITTHSANTISQKMPLWMYLSLALTSLISIIALIAWWNLRQRFNTYALRKTQEESQTAESEAQAWSQLKGHLQNTNLMELRQAIINWGKIYWKNDNIQSLNDISRFANSIELQEVFGSLDATLFGSEAHLFNKQKLKELLKDLRRRQIKKAAIDDNELRPLYKN